MSDARGTYVGRSVAGGLLVQAVTLVAGVVVTGVLVGRLGTAGYGLWVVLTTIATMASALDGGVLSGLSRHVALLRGADAEKDVRTAIGAGLTVYVVLGLLVVGAAVQFGDDAVRLLRLPAGLARSTAWAGLVLATATWAARNIWQAAAAALEGVDRMPVANVLRASIQGGVAVTVVATAVWKPSVTAVLAAGLAATLLAVPASLVLLRLSGHVSPALGTGTWRWVRAEASFGIRLQVGQLSFLSRDVVDRLVIGSILGVSAVTGYHVAFRAAALTAVVPGVLIATAVPLAARRVGSGSAWTPQELDRHGRRLIAVSTLGMAGVALGYTNLSRAWVGDASEGTYPVFVLVAMAFLISSTTGSLTVTLRAQGVLGPEMMGAIVAGLANIPLTIWLAIQFGVIGVVVASVVATMAGNTVYMWRVGPRLRSHVRSQVAFGLRAVACLAPALLAGSVIPVASQRLQAGVVGVAFFLLSAGVTTVMLRVGRVVGAEDVASLQRLIRVNRTTEHSTEDRLDEPDPHRSK